jgi:1-acyl-sn-glycerol-3-phosphate acyltransferase
VLFGLLRFRVDASGGERLPAVGYLLVAAVHRGWMDPFLVMNALPLEPRVWFLGSGPSAFDARWKEWLLHRLGGMLPVWRGGVGVEQHVASARAVLDAGGVFVLMPEGGIAGPPDTLAPFRFGSALIALRTGPDRAAGDRRQPKYLGKRFAPDHPTTARATSSAAHSTARSRPPDRASWRRPPVDDRFAELLGPEVAALYPGTADPPTHPRRLRRLTWLLLSRRPRLG